MAKIGYARVSTDDQQLDLQRDALQAAGCEQVYEDKASGKSLQRPELDHCVKAMRAGDTLIVWRLDRLGRSLSELVKFVEALEQRGIGFMSLTESIDCSGAAGRLVLHVFAALAEFERQLIQERTRAGLAAARARGRVGGRRKALTAEQEQQVRRLMSDPDVSPSRVAEQYGISRSTLYKYAPRRSDPSPVPPMVTAPTLTPSDLPPDVQAQLLGVVDELNAARAMRGAPGRWKAGKA